MMAPFTRDRDGIRVSLGRRERNLIAGLPDALRSVDPSEPAAARLDPPASLEDPEVARRFRELIGSDLDSARESDRSRFTATISDDWLSPQDAEAWMRVIGDARIVLGSRLGIEDDGWESNRTLAAAPEAAMLHYLGYLQDAMIQVLMKDL